MEAQCTFNSDAFWERAPGLLWLRMSWACPTALRAAQRLACCLLVTEIVRFEGRALVPGLKQY